MFIEFPTKFIRCLWNANVLYSLDETYSCRTKCNRCACAYTISRLYSVIVGENSRNLAETHFPAQSEFESIAIMSMGFIVPASGNWFDRFLGEVRVGCRSRCATTRSGNLRRGLWICGFKWILKWIDRKPERFSIRCKLGYQVWKTCGKIRAAQNQIVSFLWKLRRLILSTSRVSSSTRFHLILKLTTRKSNIRSMFSGSGRFEKCDCVHDVPANRKTRLRNQSMSNCWTELYSCVHGSK